jgi:hypothetical protein
VGFDTLLQAERDTEAFLQSALLPKVDVQEILQQMVDPSTSALSTLPLPHDVEKIRLRRVLIVFGAAAIVLLIIVVVLLWQFVLSNFFRHF